MQVAPCSLRSTADQGSNPRPAGPAGVRTTRQLPRTSSNNKVAKTLELLHLDHADPRRGSREHRRIVKKPPVFAHRPRRSPQRVARAQTNRKKNSSFCTSTTPIPAPKQNRKKLCTSTTPIPAEGRASPSNIAKSFEFLHLDHADFSQRVARAKAESQKTSSFCTSTTPTPAEGRASQNKIAKDFEFCTSTSPTFAEGRFSCSVVGTTPPP